MKKIKSSKISSLNIFVYYIYLTNRSINWNISRNKGFIICFLHIITEIVYYKKKMSYKKITT